MSVEAVFEERAQGKKKSGTLQPSKLTVWDVGTGKPRWSTDGRTLRGMNLSVDGGLLALSTGIGKYGEGGRSVVVYETLSGKQVKAIPLDHKRGQYADLLVFLANGNLAGAGAGEGRPQGRGPARGQ